MASPMIVLTEKSEKTVRFKTHKGNIMSLIREVYLRSDIPCQSTLCPHNCALEEGNPLLSGDLEHYILPDGPVAANYLEIFELSDIRGIVFTLSTVNYMQQTGGKRLYSRIKTCLADPGQSCILFDNEFHQDCFLSQKEDESLLQYTTRLNCASASWYRKHLRQQVPVILLTNNPELALSLSNTTEGGVLVMNLETYLTQYRSGVSAAAQLYESLTASLMTAQESKEKGNVSVNRSHLPLEVLTAGLKSGQFFKGVIHVNKYNSMTEAVVILSEGANVKDATTLRGEVIIFGREDRNRSVHGDMVCIELLPKSQWKSKSSRLQSADQESGSSEDTQGTSSPTARVVGILQRNWRDYVCSLCPPPSASSSGPPVTMGDRNRVLVTPWDRRIPFIRITTSQAEHLKTQRFIVRIDGWQEGDNNPHGHFVKALGNIGSLETETQTILIEHNLASRPFTQVQLDELPVNTAEQPWGVELAEIAKRRDFRDSHLIFSIDPIGCQDVDDTLSVVRREDGTVELGVHIADVTHFVPANSLLDMEARVRSTSVYMADRRFDMLPHTLSGDLCSLWSAVDRYAVSVVWEMTPNLEVKDVWYGRSIIRSRYKLHYELAQKIYEDAVTQEELVQAVPELSKLKEAGGDVPGSISELRTAVKELVRVASTIKERRMMQGGLELEGLEVQIQFADPNRTQMEDIMPKQPLEMHETIAECMIFANHWVARRILASYPENSCLRQHPPPRQDYFDELMRCAQAKGFQVRTDSNKTLSESLNKCVDPDDPEVNKILRTLCTQAMSNAMYFSTGSVPREKFAHYGLALNHYTHFTSPIRRYADVIVHRLLLAALKESDTTLMTNSELAQQCSHMNEQHRQAQYAQRVSTELFQCLFFKAKTEEDSCRLTDAVIYQLRTNGVVVFVPRYGIRGAVYLKRKDNSIAWPGKSSNIDWLPETSGARLERVGDSALRVIKSAGEEHLYRLFGHVTVRILIHESAAHGLALKLELVAATSSAGDRLTTGYDVDISVSGGMSKADLIQSVRTADNERIKKRRREAAGIDSDSDDDEGFDKLHSTSSIYHFFLGLKEGDRQSVE